MTAANWYLDDLPPHMFIKDAPNSHGFVDARTTLELWKSHFKYFYREEEWFVFPLTIHPDVSGRPHMLLILEELIEWINGHGELFLSLLYRPVLTRCFSCRRGSRVGHDGRE